MSPSIFSATEPKIALRQQQIELNDLMNLRIGGLVNNIRKNNRQNNQCKFSFNFYYFFLINNLVKAFLRSVIQEMQAFAGRGTNGNTNGARVRFFCKTFF